MEGTLKFVAQHFRPLCYLLAAVGGLVYGKSANALATTIEVFSWLTVGFTEFNIWLSCWIVAVLTVIGLRQLATWRLGI